MVSNRRAGGLKAKEKIKKRFGPDFYVKIGKKGGKLGNPKGKGFASGKVDPKAAGRKGGAKSKRGKARKNRAII